MGPIKTVNIDQSEPGFRNYINIDPCAQCHSVDIKDIWMIEKGKIFYDPCKDISITEPVKMAIKLLNRCSIQRRDLILLEGASFPFINRVSLKMLNYFLERKMDCCQDSIYHSERKHKNSTNTCHACDIFQAEIDNQWN